MGLLLKQAMIDVDLSSVFPADVQFSRDWRPHQQRVLDDLERHLQDGHFHLVAPPGSGKTVLGLEVVRRLGHPALIAAPTIAVREQWVQRLMELFLPRPERPDWVSTDLEHPGLLTVATFHALHTASRRQVGLAAGLAAAGVRTLLLDEAHHLRNQWWQTLDRVKRALSKPFIVALTATLPLDATQVEWNRYVALCGPVDIEISVPELVRAGSLCPHQDYVHLGLPTAAEEAEIRAFRTRSAALLRDLALDEAFIAALKAHPVVVDPVGQRERLLADGELYLSMLLFLHHATGVAPGSLRKALGLRGVALPPITAGWAEVLLSGVLFREREHLSSAEPRLQALQQELRSMGALLRRQVVLQSSPHLNRRLRSSPARLHGIAEIVEHESRTLDWRLSLVILADRIREEAFPGTAGVEGPLARLGVVPIFEHLRRLRLPGVRLGILTGRLAVIPASAEAGLRVLAGEVPPGWLQPLPHDSSYLGLNLRESTRQGLVVKWLTRLLGDGEISVLVGTTSLLGEGWDAPSLNTLVLASEIGAFVSANQLRGRAIRTNPQRPHKAANIWHLAYVGPGTEAGAPTDATAAFSDIPEDAADDLDLLTRRFRAFLGLSTLAPEIVNGIERLGLDPRHAAGWDRMAMNARSFRLAEQREALAAGWRAAIVPAAGGAGRVALDVLLPAPRQFGIPIFRHWLERETGLLAWLRRWRLQRHTQGVASALLGALQGAGMVAAELRPQHIAISVSTREMRVRVDAGDARTERLITESLREIYDPLFPARYLLHRWGRVWRVPQALGSRKELAALYTRHWRREVGRAALVYLHTERGKMLALHARQRFLATAHAERPRVSLRWV